jgi:hypothetical protein
MLRRTNACHIIGIIARRKCLKEKDPSTLTFESRFGSPFMQRHVTINNQAAASLTAEEGPTRKQPQQQQQWSAHATQRAQADDSRGTNDAPRRKKRRREKASATSEASTTTAERMHEQLMAKIDALSRAMDTKIDALSRDLAAAMDTKNAALQTLIAPQTAMFQKLGQTTTLVGDWEAHLTIAGAESTLNYAELVDKTTGESTFIAIGAAHCALFTPSTGNVRVYVPPELAVIGVRSVLIPRGLLDVEQCRARDIIAFKLAQRPSVAGVIPKIRIPESVAALMERVSTSPTTCGRSHSINVFGHCLQYDDEELAFVEEAGEPGNSGALMFATAKHGIDGTADFETLIPLGTYFGTLPCSSNRKPRGVIAPLSALHGALEREVLGPAQEERSADGKMKYTFYEIAGPSIFNGAAVCGNLGCGRASASCLASTVG